MGPPHGSYHRYMRSLVLAALGGQQELLAMMPVRDLADSLIENSLRNIGRQRYIRGGHTKMHIQTLSRIRTKNHS